MSKDTRAADFSRCRNSTTATATLDACTHTQMFGEEAERESGMGKSSLRLPQSMWLLACTAARAHRARTTDCKEEQEQDPAGRPSGQKGHDKASIDDAKLPATHLTDRQKRKEKKKGGTRGGRERAKCAKRAKRIRAGRARGRYKTRKTRLVKKKERRDHTVHRYYRWADELGIVPSACFGAE
jgi:hypothetical protein